MMVVYGRKTFFNIGSRSDITLFSEVSAAVSLEAGVTADLEKTQPIFKLA
jgi:hypothetical protein